MIYLDNAATTQVCDSSNKVLYDAGRTDFYNASALYRPAAEADAKINECRALICNGLRAAEGNLYFMSGGTEADNTALLCTRIPKDGRVIVSAGEHDAVFNPAKELKARGFDVRFAPINPDGSVDKESFVALLNGKVALVSIMHVSNETGAVNDIKWFNAVTKRNSPSAVFHSDGVQAFCKIPVNLASLGVDLYSISAHKLHAPKGIGALFVKKGVSIKPLILGGGQEYGFRSGTENSPMIFAFAQAVKENLDNFDANYSKNRAFTEHLKQKLIELLPDSVFITPETGAAPHILTAAFAGVRGEVLLHCLEKRGILVGIGSACSSHKESRFKNLLGLDDVHKDGVVRFSVSSFNQPEEAEITACAVKEECDKLKEIHRR